MTQINKRTLNTEHGNDDLALYPLRRAPKGGTGGVHDADAEGSYPEDQEEGGADQDPPARSRCC